MRPEISKLILPLYPLLQDHPDVLRVRRGVSQWRRRLNGHVVSGRARCVCAAVLCRPQPRRIGRPRHMQVHTHTTEYKERNGKETDGGWWRQSVERARGRLPDCAVYVLGAARVRPGPGHGAGSLCRPDHPAAQGMHAVCSALSLLTHTHTQAFREAGLPDVHLCSVDQYQGEENDIVLLSLVRSNDRGSIGFLSVSNRVCVALSRAREGFYLIGNATLLRAQSALWRQILGYLADGHMTGPYLTLQVRRTGRARVCGLTVRCGAVSAARRPLRPCGHRRRLCAGTLCSRPPGQTDTDRAHAVRCAMAAATCPAAAGCRAATRARCAATRTDTRTYRVRMRASACSSAGTGAGAAAANHAAAAAKARPARCPAATTRYALRHPRTARALTYGSGLVCTVRGGASRGVLRAGVRAAAAVRARVSAALRRPLRGEVPRARDQVRRGDGVTVTAG
jgi:hypothetical protein